ncbi:cyclase family protein [Vibrio sp. JC009]|uniref:cyclase family protein n=1 Tax=Vibrio sp. JC009 TaxID=2912314 RepID=UPI0023AEC903|nr:cyclase family protein [Vibrio sp. JC009]WED23441.1 cyclase family protein [Vibrio sp. JC009]
MKIHDISVPFSEGMMKYPSLAPFERKWLRSFENGDQNQVSYIQAPSHVGTHLDAPCHYIKGGKTMDDIPLERFYGKCQVIEVPDEYPAVSKEFLSNIKFEADKIIFKTSNLKYRMEEFKDDYVYIESEAAQYIVDQGVKFVGVDYVSVDAKVSPDKPSHMILLGNEVIIMECAYVKDIEPGVYTLNAFPLKITGAEGSFCRATLLED